jgi:hypothetical protein
MHFILSLLFFPTIYFRHFLSVNIDSCHDFNICEQLIQNGRFQKGSLDKLVLHRSLKNQNQEAEMVARAFSAEGKMWLKSNG